MSFEVAYSYLEIPEFWLVDILHFSHKCQLAQYMNCGNGFGPVFFTHLSGLIIVFIKSFRHFWDRHTDARQCL